MAHGVTIQVYRTATANNPPAANSLAQGELAVEMASSPPNLWCGVPTSIAASGRILLNGATASGVTSWNTRTGAVTLQAADVTGVGGALLASPTFTGTPAAPTASPGTNTTQLATTAFVTAAVSAGTAGVTSFNTRTGAVTLLATDVTGVGGALLASPTFTGVPAAPTATAGTSTTQLATTAFVTGAIAAIPPAAVTSVTGTANQILATTASGAVTLSLIGPYTPATYAAHGVLLGEGTSSIVAVAPGTSGYVLTSQGASADPIWSAPTGGAGVSSITGTANQIAASSSTGAVTLSLIGPYTPATFTGHGLLVGEGASSIASVAPTATGRVLFSNGLSVDPSWSPTPTLGVPGSTNGTLTLANSVGSGTVTFASPASLGTSYTVTWPAAVPGNYQVPFFTSPGIMGLTGSPSDSGQVLQWNGSQPRWTSQPGLGNSGSSAGTLSLTGGLGGNGTVTLASQTAAYTNYTFQFPAGAPSNGSLLVFSGGTGVTNGLADVAVGQVLTSQGATGVPAWSASPSLTGVTLSTPLSIASGGTGSATAPTAGQVSIAQSASAYGPVTMSGDATITSAGVVTVAGIRSTAVPTLAAGYLYYNGTAFVWQTPSGGGTVTSITAGTGLTGGTITNTGTIALSVPVSIANGGTNATTAPAALTQLGAAPTASPTFTGTVTFPDGSSIVTSASNGTAGNLYGFQNSTGIGIGIARTAGAPPTGGNALMLGQTLTPCIFLQASGYGPSASIQYNPGISGFVNTGYGSYLNGSSWIATIANAAILGFNPSGPTFQWYIDSGLTVGATYNPTQRMVLTTQGLLIYGSSSQATQLYVGGDQTTAGCTLTSVGTPNFNLVAGAYYNGSGGWICNATTALLNNATTSGFGWYAATGLTVGAALPGWTNVATLDTSGNLTAGRFYPGGAPTNTCWFWNASQNASAFNTNNAAHWYMRDTDWLVWNPTGTVGGYGAYQNLSDIRSKSNVAPEGRGLEIIRQLQPIMFQRSMPDGKLRVPEVGFSAQDIRSVLPEAVAVMGSLLPDGSGGLDSDEPSLAITYDSIVTVLVNAVKQLDARLAAVEAQ